MALIQKIVSEVSVGSLVVVCIQDTGNKVELLNRAIDVEKRRKRIADRAFKYTFEDSASGHTSETEMRMIAIEK